MCDLYIYARANNGNFKLHVDNMYVIFELFRGNDQMLRKICNAKDPNKRIIIKSDVSKEIVIQFWNYITGRIQEIDNYNLLEYKQLSHEFGVKEDEFNQKELDYEKCFIEMKKKIEELQLKKNREECRKRALLRLNKMKPMEKIGYVLFLMKKKNLEKEEIEMLNNLSS